MSAVAARGTVEMLNAPERVKVSTDVPSQPLSSTVDHCRAQILAVSLQRELIHHRSLRPAGRLAEARCPSTGYSTRATARTSSLGRPRRPFGRPHKLLWRS